MVGVVGITGFSAALSSVEGERGRRVGKGALCPVQSEYVWALSSRRDTILVFSVVAIIPGLFRRIGDLLKKV